MGEDPWDRGGGGSGGGHRHWGRFIGGLVGGIAGGMMGGPLGAALGGGLGSFMGSLMDGDDGMTAAHNGAVDGVVGLVGGIAIGKAAGLIGKALGRLGGAVGDAAGGAGEGACSAAGQCFAAGTLVQMADGTTKPIEQVKAGDWVASRDAEKTEKSHDKVKSGENVGKQVARSFVTEKMPTVKVTFSNGETLQCTTGHPFYVEGKGFTPADRLAIGNAIVTRAGPNVKVRKVEKTGITTVYNFEVGGTHTYFVGKTQAWVHNDCTDIAKSLLPKVPGEFPDAVIFRLEPSPQLGGYVADANGVGNLRMGKPLSDCYYHDVVHSPSKNVVWDPMTSGGSTAPIPYNEWLSRWQYGKDGLIFGPK